MSWRMQTYGYATLARMPQIGAIPMDGLVMVHAGSCTTPSGRHAFGYALYARKLTEEEIKEYELEEVDPGYWYKSQAEIH